SSYFARHTAHFGSERIELVHHRVDGVLELENFAFHIHRDFAGQVATSDGRRHVRDVSNLASQVRRHGVDVVREVLPRSGDAGYFSLAAELAFRSDFTRNTCHFRSERAELFDHRVDGFFELQNLTANVDGYFLGQVAVRHGDRHLSDVAHLGREV